MDMYRYHSNKTLFVSVLVVWVCLLAASNALQMRSMMYKQDLNPSVKPPIMLEMASKARLHTGVQAPKGDKSRSKSLSATAIAVKSLLEAETRARLQSGQGNALKNDAGEPDKDTNPTSWWPGRTEFTQAMNEVESKIGGDEAQEFWWLANAPWFLPPPPEWGPIKPQMYANYYFKPVRHNYELPNVQGQNAPWYAPHYQNSAARAAALGTDMLGTEHRPYPSANDLAGPSVRPSEFNTMGIDDAFKLTINADKVQTADMGGNSVAGSDSITNYGNRGATLGTASSQYASPYVMQPCNPYFPQSCGAYHPGWHPEPPRQAEFYPPHDAPTFSPDSSKAVPPLGGETSFLETHSELDLDEASEMEDEYN